MVLVILFSLVFSNHLWFFVANSKLYRVHNLRHLLHISVLFPYSYGPWACKSWIWEMFRRFIPVYKALKWFALTVVYFKLHERCASLSWKTIHEIFKFHISNKYIYVVTRFAEHIIRCVCMCVHMCSHCKHQYYWREQALNNRSPRC